MMIASIEINRLFNEYDYTLDLHQGLTFLHSPNGYGKSTLMRLVYSALRGDVKYISQVPFERMDIIFTDGTALIIESNEGDLFIQAQKNELETEITPDEMAELCRCTYIPPERLVFRRRDGNLTPALEAYAHELYEKICLLKEQAELIPYTGERRNMSDGELESWCRDLKARLDFTKDAGFIPKMPSSYRFPPNRYDISNYRQDYEDLAYSIQHYLDTHMIIAESISVYKDMVNNIFMNKTLEILQNGKMIVNMANGTSLQLGKLSSGERQILIMFYILLFHAEPGSIVIIDEPEISLHVSWQHKLAPYFCDICRVRGLQMIVATHSPQVINDKWDIAEELKPENA